MMRLSAPPRPSAYDEGCPQFNGVFALITITSHGVLRLLQAGAPAELKQRTGQRPTVQGLPGARSPAEGWRGTSSICWLP